MFLGIFDGLNHSADRVIRSTPNGEVETMGNEVYQGDDGYWRVRGQPETTYYSSEAIASQVARALAGEVPGCDDDLDDGDDDGSSLSDEEADTEADRNNGA
jgi:hypothetical protein